MVLENDRDIRTLAVLRLLAEKVDALNESIKSLSDKVGILDADHPGLAEELRQTAAKIKDDNTRMTEMLDEGYNLLKEKIEEHKKLLKRISILERQMIEVNAEIDAKLANRQSNI